MKKMLRMVSILLVVLMAISLISCGTQKSIDNSTTGNTSSQTTAKEEPKKDITIKFVTCNVGEEPSAAVLKNLTDEFNVKNTDNHVKAEVDGVAEYTNCLNKVKTNIAANQPIDLFWVFEDIRSKNFWGAGKLGDLTPYIDDELKSYKTDSDWADATIDGKIYGVGYQAFYLGMFYNTEIFSKLGISLPMKDWDEFFAACDKIKAAGIAPNSFQTIGTGWEPMLLWSAYVGGKLGQDFLKDRTTFDDPAFIDGANFLLKLKDYTTKDAVGLDYPAAVNYFLTGKTAMMANGPWMISDANKSAIGGKFAYTSFPGQKGGQYPVMISGPNAKMVTSTLNEKDPDRMKAIVSYMKWLSAPDNAKRMIIESGNTYTGKVTFTDSDKIDPVTKQLLDLENSAVIKVNQIRDAVPAAFATAFEEEIANLWTGKTTPEQFCKNLTAKTYKN